MNAAAEREALRQQMLLRAVWRDARPGVLAGWTRDGERFERGLQAYQANAGALAERALAAAFPTLQQLLGEASFAALARAFWHLEPPLRGDIGVWGSELPAFIAGDTQLASEPYLADVALLEWAVHQAQSAADMAAGGAALELLATADPDAVRLQARPGTALLASRHPIVTVWHAHRSEAPDRFAPVQAAFAQGRAECALVWRAGWRVEVAALPEPERAFTQALLAGATLGAALAAADPDFCFEPWLIATLQRGWLAGAQAVREETSR
jgi:hypothetical protein